MKRVLVLGSTGGIGKACCEVFGLEKDYEIFGVSRSARAEKPANTRVNSKFGNLKDVKFRESLVKETRPNVVIATFGQWPENSDSMVDTLNEFAMSIIDLFERCESDGSIEHFIVISSLSAQMSAIPHAYRNKANHQYVLAKRFLSDFFRQTMIYGRSKSKILLLEPGFVRSGFAGVENRFNERPEHDPITRGNYNLIDPAAVAELIHKSVSNPQSTSASVTLYNQSMSKSGIPGDEQRARAVRFE